ncbi:hypothetical protein NMG60_11024484 [Bertholletia excelsa]
MEKENKPTKLKNKILKLLPKLASSFSFHNAPFSPSSRDKRPDFTASNIRAHAGKGFSGPMVSLIPVEARGKPKNPSFVAHEPTSPKVSCIGQINHKKKVRKEKEREKRKSDPKALNPDLTRREPKKNAGRISAANRPAGGPPGLGQIKRFASGRERLTVQIAPMESDHRNYISDEESDVEEAEPIIPFSAPIAGGGGGVIALEPRKEINLWKRRTMAQPRPLRVNF